jgi:murein DD-endopeptidase
MLKRVCDRLFSLLIVSGLSISMPVFAAPVAASTATSAHQAPKKSQTKTTKAKVKHHAAKKTTSNKVAHTAKTKAHPTASKTAKAVNTRHANAKKTSVTTSKPKITANKSKVAVSKAHTITTANTHKKSVKDTKHHHTKALSHAATIPVPASNPQDYMAGADRQNFANALTNNNSANQDFINGGFNQQMKAHLADYQTNICANAEAQIGKPYEWGVENPDSGFDCSGLSQFVYAQEGIQIPRTALEQYHSLLPVKHLKEGDLVFFHTHERSRLVSHVGIYIGDGYFVHSPRTGESIRMSRLSDAYWREHYAGARRVLTPHTVAKTVALAKANSADEDS